MRISDWSADVCSSDLYDLTLLDFSGNYPVYDAALRVHAGYAQVQSEILPGISLDAGVRYEHGRQSVTGVDVYSRSEEHTSELQSLMRISYAVFCLKKKKFAHTSQIHSDFTTLLATFRLFNCIYPLYIL